MTKKRVLLLVAALLAVCAIVAAVIFWPRPVDPAEGARQALLQLAENAKAGEDAPDTLEDNGGRAVFRNSKTLDYLMEDIQLTKNVEDITDVLLKTWPTPMYYFGDVEVGGNNGCFIASYGDKTFLFHLGYPYDKKFSHYLAALEKSSPRYGIHTID